MASAAVYGNVPITHNAIYIVNLLFEVFNFL